MNTEYKEVSTSLREATFPTLYEAEHWRNRVREDYPVRGYDTSTKITERDGQWTVTVKRYNSAS